MSKKEKVCFETLPRASEIAILIKEVRNYFHPGYFEKKKCSDACYLANKKKKISRLYRKYVCDSTSNEFISSLDEVKESLYKDLDFFMLSDPAIENRDEVIISYPGFLAITYYRIAHVIYGLGVFYVPRIITEMAHSLTGIDIHPGAKIGVPFFIDHGTGIVIGETSEIGRFVKMYHGVTLGALSLKDGSGLRGKKRHPTVKDYVTIYSGASILGGETIIEDGVTLGSNVFIVNSVLKDTKVIYSSNNINIKK